MTEQTTSTETSTGGKGYNLKITPKGDITVGQNSNGKTKIRFRGTFVSKGKTKERTVIAQGVAADQISGKVVEGQEIGLRCLFERAPANDNGKGGEFLTVIGEPLPPKQKAA